MSNDNGLRGSEFLLTAEKPGVKFQQIFTNITEYLIKAQELQDMGLKVTSWYDETYLSRLS